jgi:putative FmdB family regulatory protein
VPTYEYRCKKGHRYDRREPFGSPRKHECEKCGEPASRQLNAPAIAFKGSGWYKTDSRASDNIGTDRNKKKPKPEVATPGSDSSSAKRSATGTSQAKSETTNSNSSSSAKKGAKSD